jgi:hypothetical protein
MAAIGFVALVSPALFGSHMEVTLDSVYSAARI